MAASTSTVILFKKEKEPVDEYNNMFKAAGLDVIFIPVLDIIHCNGDELSNALSRPKDFSGIVFTSQSAVTSVAISCTNIDIKCLWDALPVFVVGKATSDCVRSNLRIEPVGECSGNAESLSDFIISNYKSSLVKPLLFPCGNIHKETLPMKLSNEGIKIQPVICYNTVPHPSLSSRLSSMKWSSSSSFIGMVFFSPSGVYNVIPILQSTQLTHDSSIKYCAIGPSTGEALQSFGIAHVTAAKPTASEVLKLFICQ